MVTYYLDTSALLKQYLNETGSQWLRQTITPHDVRVTSQIAIIETVSGFNRRLREGSVTPHDYARLSGRLRQDSYQLYQLIGLNTPIINLAWNLLEQHLLRGYDAVHLATALFIQQKLTQSGEAPLIFLSADNRLLTAAQTEGIATDNPNLYP